MFCIFLCSLIFVSCNRVIVLLCLLSENIISKEYQYRIIQSSSLSDLDILGLKFTVICGNFMQSKKLREIDSVFEASTYLNRAQFLCNIAFRRTRCYWRRIKSVRQTTKISRSSLFSYVKPVCPGCSELLEKTSHACYELTEKIQNKLLLIKYFIIL